jgi:hypothetical protein
LLAHFLSQKSCQYIKDQRQQNSAGACQKIPSLLHTQNGCRSPGYFFVVCRKYQFQHGRNHFSKGLSNNRWKHHLEHLQEFEVQHGGQDDLILSAIQAK